MHYRQFVMVTILLFPFTKAERWAPLIDLLRWHHWFLTASPQGLSQLPAKRVSRQLLALKPTRRNIYRDIRRDADLQPHETICATYEPRVGYALRTLPLAVTRKAKE